MTTQTIRRDRGFHDTRALEEKPATHGSGPMRNFLREAGESLRGTFEAPLRYVLSPRGDSALQTLNEAIRRDIGL